MPSPPGLRAPDPRRIAQSTVAQPWGRTGRITAGRCPPRATDRVGAAAGQASRTAAATSSSRYAGVPPRDLELLGPPEVELDVELDGEADAAEDLLGGGGHVPEGLAGEELGHRGQLGHAPALRPGPGRLVDQHLGPVHGGGGVGQVVGQRLEGPERLVELLAVLGVLHGDLQGVLGPAHGLGRGQDDPVVHDRVPGRPAAARRRRCGRRAVTRTWSRSTRYWASEAMDICWVRVTPGAAGSTRNRSTASAAVAGPGQDHQRGGRLGEGHVALGAGEDEPVAVGHRPDLDALGPEAVLGLEPRRGQDGLAGDDAGQPLLLLLPAPGPGQGPAARGRSSRSGARGPASARTPRRPPRSRRPTCPSRRTPRAAAGRSGRGGPAASTARASSRWGRPRAPGPR